MRKQLASHKTVGKNGGTRVITLISNGDGTLMLRPMGKSNVRLDMEMLKFISSRATIASIRRHLKRVKNHMKTFGEFENVPRKIASQRPTHVVRPDDVTNEELISVEVTSESTDIPVARAVTGPVSAETHDVGCACAAIEERNDTLVTQQI